MSHRINCLAKSLTCKCVNRRKKIGLLEKAYHKALQLYLRGVRLYSTGVSLEEAQEIAIQKHREYINAEQTVRTMDGLTKVKKKKGR